MNFSQFRKRNLEDQLRLYAVGATFLFVFPFAIYRTYLGDHLLGIIDSIVSILLVAIFIQTWRSKKIKHFNILVVMILMVSILGVIYVRSTEMIFWAYPVIAAAYFLLSARTSLFLNCLFIVSVGAIGSLFKGLPVISVYPSLFLVAIFGFIFSMRSESQTKTLTQLVSEDALTEVSNRRSFDEKVQEVIANNNRSKKPVSLMILDLDFFKKINDFHGHKQGDKVLIDFAQTVKSMIRKTDYIYRFGGEEFVVIANNSSLENAGKFADTIREVIQKTPEMTKYDVTVSIGVAEIKLTDDADSWFRRADLALYESKSQGRNRVYLAEQDENQVISFKPVKRKTGVKAPPQPPNKSQDDNLSSNTEALYNQSKPIKHPVNKPSQGLI